MIGVSAEHPECAVSADRGGVSPSGGDRVVALAGRPAVVAALITIVLVAVVAGLVDIDDTVTARPGSVSQVLLGVRGASVSGAGVTALQ